MFLGPLSRNRLFWLALLLAALLGTWLRAQQWASQVLMGDEWHAIHQLVYYSPSAAARTFGYADHSIPLVLLAFFEMRWTAFNEALLRWPMLAAGVATLALLPWMWRKRLDDSTVILFAFLLACSSLLVCYARMGRPYALTLFLVYAAYALFARSTAHGTLRWGAALGYALLCGLAVWAHPITGPLLVAPLLATGWQRLRGLGPHLPWPAFLGLCALTGAMMALAVMPPLILDSAALAKKSGVNSIGWDTVLGATHLWFGTGSTWLLAVVVALSFLGASAVLRALPEARWLLLGVALTVLALLFSRPWWIDKPAALARYLLPVVPILLLMLAAGSMRLANLLPAPARTAGVLAIGATVLAAGVATSPLPEMLVRPNSYAQDYYFHYDYRRPLDPLHDGRAGQPDAVFWNNFAVIPPATLTFAVAPFQYSSHAWPVPVWERVSRQRVIPAFLWGACVPTRHGEVPPKARFALANAVHVIDRERLIAQGVDYLVYYMPGPILDSSPPVPQCESAVRSKYGDPDYEDAVFAAWRLNPAAPVPSISRKSR